MRPMTRKPFSRRTLLVALLASSLWVSSATGVASASSIEGDYRAADGSHAIALFRCGVHLCGKITWTRQKGVKDVKNPAPALRARLVVGIRHLHGLTQRGAHWVNGKLYNPEDGRSYRAEAWRNGKQLVIEGRPDVPLVGAVLARLFGRISYVPIEHGKAPARE